MKSKKYLLEHMKCHNDNVLLRCPECPMTFKTRSTRQKHINTAHKRKCSICDKVFKSSEELLKHKATHFNSYYVCPFCQKTVKLKSSLQRHLKKVHPFENPTNIELNCKVVKNLSSENLPKENTVKSMQTNDENENLQKITDNDNIVTNDDVEFLNREIEKYNSRNEKAASVLIQNIGTTYEKNCLNVDDFDDLSLNSVLMKTRSSNFHNELNVLSSSNISEAGGILDFNNIEMDLVSTFELHQPSVNINNQEMCLSLPDITQDNNSGIQIISF